MAVVDYGKMVGGRLGGGWLGVLVIVCATNVLVPHQHNIFKTAKYKRNNKQVKGILKVAKNGQKWPLSDIWSITYQSKALFTTFSSMLLSYKPSWFVCKLLEIH